MAKKEKEVTSNMKDLTKKFMEISKKVSKDVTEYGSTLDSSIYSNIDEYIDTGSYALNRLITGSIFGGIPRGRVIAMAGQSGVGKSILTGLIIRNAQKMGYLVVHYDTENAVDNEFMQRIGVNTSEMLYFPIDVIEEFRNHAINTCRQLITENPDTKILIVLDSFGNLSSAKDKRDLEAGKDNSDQGARAKAGKSMLKEMTHFCGKYRVPFIFTNHCYKDMNSAPDPKYAKDIQSGGNQATYISSAVIMLKKKAVKEEGEDGKKKVGNMLTAISEKNRLCPEGEHIETYLSFKNGPNRYYGLLPDAIACGEIEAIDSKKVKVKHLDRVVRVSELYTKEVFTDDMLQKIDAYCKDTYKYSTLSLNDELNSVDLKEEIN